MFGNIKKYLMYLLSSNIGEIGLMVGSVLLGLPLPLTAVQILYVNLATDGLPALALWVEIAKWMGRKGWLGTGALDDKNMVTSSPRKVVNG